MQNTIIFCILVVALVVGIIYTVKHFRGEGGCCGGDGKALKSRKKLTKITGTKTVVIEGMTCENCANRVEWAINDIEGLVAKVNLKKNEAAVSMDRDVSDDVIRAAVEKAGYKVTEIK